MANSHSRPAKTCRSAGAVPLPPTCTSARTGTKGCAPKEAAVHFDVRENADSTHQQAPNVFPFMTFKSVSLCCGGKKRLSKSLSDEKIKIQDTDKKLVSC